MGSDPTKDCSAKYMAKPFTVSQLFLDNQENSELIARWHMPAFGGSSRRIRNSKAVSKVITTLSSVWTTWHLVSNIKVRIPAPPSCSSHKDLGESKAYGKLQARMSSEKKSFEREQREHFLLRCLSCPKKVHFLACVISRQGKHQTWHQ